MRNFWIVAGFFLTAPVWAHGGRYAGPGDLLPPGGGGTPTGTTPSGPAPPSAPSGPGRPSPTTPNTPHPPALPTPPGQVPRTTVTGVAPPEPDLAGWERWWSFNRYSFLQLRAKLQDTSGATDSGSELLRGLELVSSGAHGFAPSENQIRALVLPPLERALDEDQRDILTAALVALARIGRDPSLVHQFLPLLAHSEQEVSETAALALGILRDPQALDPLEDLLQDTESGRKLTGRANGVPERTRTFAAYGLGLLGAATTDDALRSHIAATLRQTLDAQGAESADLAVACVLALGLVPLLDPEPSVSFLSARLQDERFPSVARAHAPTSMARLLRAHGPSPLVGAAVGRWRTLLADPHADTLLRQSCVLAIGVVAPVLDESTAAGVAEELIRVASQGSDEQERNFTAIALGDLAAVAAADSELRTSVDEFLSRSLEKGRNSYHTWAALGLGVTYFPARAGQRAVPAFVLQGLREAFAHTSDPSVRSCYALALGLVHDEGSKEAIHEVLQEAGDPSLRGYCCVALGLLDAREYTEDLVRTTRESVRIPELLQQAAIGLGLLHDRRVTGELLELLAPDDGQSPRLATLGSIATALALIGDASALEPLAGYAVSQELTPAGRAFAIIALGLICEQTDPSWNSALSADFNYRAAVGTLTDPSWASGILDLF